MTQTQKEKSNLPTNAIVEKFDMLSPMLESALIEMREFSKKKQDGIINPLKIKFLNRLLSDIKDILKDDKSFQYLEILDEETLPQNSDAVLILGQFKAAMRQFHDKYYRYDSNLYKDRWFTQERP